MSRYQPQRRRGFQIPVRLLAVLLVLVVGVLAVTQTVRASRANGQVKELQAQITTLNAEKAQLTERLPAIEMVNAMSQTSFEYQKLYPEMKVDPLPSFAEIDPKAVYLTFDDGPSANTPKILDALKAADVKATFFILGQNIKGNEALIKRMADEGHAVGIHTFSHDYKAIYASVDAYLEDFQKTYQAIHDACGVYPTVFRFPGGSINGYNGAVYQQIIAEMTRRGFVYYDWSVSSQDATGKTYSADQIAQFVVSGTQGAKHPIVLMHDSPAKTSTAQAVPSMIQQLKAKGYTFAPITNAVVPTNFGYPAMK